MLKLLTTYIQSFHVVVFNEMFSSNSSDLSDHYLLYYIKWQDSNQDWPIEGPDPYQSAK